MQHAASRLDLDRNITALAPAPANDTASWLRATQRQRLARTDETADQLEILLDVERWRASEPGIQALLEAGASMQTALRGVGLHWWSQGQPARAVRPFLAALLFGPESVDVLLDLGSVLQADGQIDEGLAAFLRATQIAPEDVRAWVKAGLLLQAAGMYDSAGEHFETALSCDANCSDASAGLGMVRFGQQRYDEAARHLSAVAADYPDHTIGLALGQSLYMSGDFSRAADAFRPFAASSDTDPRIRQRYALCRMLQFALLGTAEAALAAWRDAAGELASEPGRAIRQAFDILRGYGHSAAALQLAALDASEIHPYLIDALRGLPIECAPADYISQHFDGFAETFDQQLVGVLNYDTPKRLAQLLAPKVERQLRIADLGCGTGLSGGWLKGLASELVGVDLSARMLEKAADKRVYDALHAMDIDHFLKVCTAPFDCLTLADVLIYRGPLQTFFNDAYGALTPHGLLAFSLETTAVSTHELRPSGRFAHNVKAVISDAKPWFDILEVETTILRLEANEPVQGAIFLMRRKMHEAA